MPRSTSEPSRPLWEWTTYPAKKTAMIEREILMHMIAYNLVMALMLAAACESDVSPERI